ncbi:DUF4855 domain-containing protein [Thermococcus sp. JdF3]|uniref:DUF4855 domain-containing protein n=1 Tax=Thermococcus sp. JdF3 TaxID=1638258 RepID=UPI00143AD868|nr:DUF4855 domain-containing protein [Thermococcus sp. JdF3]NJE00497.1 DUF4855 domain-containing protein [Thermococcus sp. JdF3]
MLKFGLWWVRWDENLRTYTSRMTLGGKRPTSYDEAVQWFKNRGFDRVVFLSGEGKGINYTGNGYDDGLRMALWLSSRIGSMNYYVPIPFYKYESKKPRDNPSEGFNNSYWKDWIDGVLSVVDSNRLGFYWSYESCLQTTPNDGTGVSVEFIQKMSNYVHDHGQELIWIPATGNRGVTYLRKDAFDGILKIGGYFDYVFVQPNYYQYPTLDEKGNHGLPYTYEKLVEKIRWIYEELPKKIKEQNPNSTTTVSIEMEADRTVRGIPCGYSSKCPENMTCDRNLKTCYENCKEHEHGKAINYALDYMRALHDIGWEPSDRAYYFSNDLKVIDALQERCRRELNEPYV